MREHLVHRGRWRNVVRIASESAKPRLGEGKEPSPLATSCVKGMKLAMIFDQLNTDNRQILLPESDEKNALLYVECLKERVCDVQRLAVAQFFDLRGDNASCARSCHECPPLANLAR